MQVVLGGGRRFHAALVGPKKELQEASANVLGVFGSARNTISTPPQNLNTTDIYVQRKSALRGSFDFTCAASAPRPTRLVQSWLLLVTLTVYARTRQFPRLFGGNVRKL